MAKRIADKELTDRNWDQEDEGEEAGMFSVASEDVLKNRPIKKAKRRNAGSEGQSGPAAFKVFKGFSLAPAGGGGTKGFSLAPAGGGGGTKAFSLAPGGGGGTTAFSGFGNGGFKGLGGLTNGDSTTPTFGGFAAPAASSPSPAALSFNGPASSTKPPVSSSDIITGKQLNGSAPSSLAPPPSLASQSPGSGSKEYSRQLTALNCSVRDWITKHVNGNPLCDLNPIFRDYEQHLASIEKKYGGGGGGTGAAADGGSESSKQAPPGEKTTKQEGGLLLAASAAPSFSSSSSSTLASSTAPATTLSFGKDKQPESPAAVEKTPVPAGITFNFGQKVDSSVLGSLGSGGAPPSFSFSSTTSSSSSLPSPGSLFGGAGSAAAPFSFSSGAKATVQPTADENGEEESDEPPKVEVREIKEKDAFYSKKCKLFYKKETEFKEKGVGTLHLKTTAEGKTQVLVRADTNLGNILLNVLLHASMPCSRMGKNNVMVVCVPNPPVDEQNPAAAVPMLVRVKTTEDADELFHILQEKKA